MKKETHDVIQKYDNMVAKLYFEMLELGLNEDKVNELIEKFDDFRDETYKIKKSEEKGSVLNKEAMLIDEYENWDKYLRLLVLYEYDNGFSLCETTAGNICLIPSELISFDVEIRGGWQRQYV